MNVLFTLGFLAALAFWALAVYNRLHRMRRQILTEWKKLDAREQAGETDVDGTRYNQLAVAYNAALAGFPDNFIAALAGFRPAQMFVNTKR
ncbi:MAG: hypothetical protein AB7P34_01060 [Vicinamibacterales bacterium]